MEDTSPSDVTMAAAGHNPSPTSTSSSSSKDKSSGGKMKFSSTLGTIVTLLGYSVGTSDFWRFPFLVYRNGGGAFLIPFLVIVILCGVPLYFLEYSISSFSGRGTYQLWDIMPLFRGVSYSIVVSYCIYITYIAVFRCWMIEFLVNSFQSTLPWSVCDNSWNTDTCRSSVFSRPEIYNNTPTSYYNSNATFYGNVTSHESSGISNLGSTTQYEYLDNAAVYDRNYTGFVANTTLAADVPGMSAAEEFWQYRVLELSSGISDFGGMQWKYVLYSVAQRIIVVLCCYKSIKSIEKVMYVSTFGPILLVTAIFIRSLMLPGAVDGIKHFFYTDFTKLAEPRIWVEASLMVFYTIGFGWGGIVLLGSHSAFHENTLRTSLIVTSLDITVAVYNGVICFSVLGNMAHTLGSPVDQVINAGMSVGMVAYPSAIASLPVPQVWSALFFVSLLLQGFDTQFVVTEMVVQQLGNIYPNIIKRFRMLLLILVSSLFFVGGLPLCTKAGGYIFLFLDWYTGVWIGPVVSLIELIVFVWIYVDCLFACSCYLGVPLVTLGIFNRQMFGGDRFSYDVSLMFGRPLPAAMRISLAFITPIIVLILLVVSLASYVPPTYGDYSYPVLIRVLGWVIVTVTMTPIILYIGWLGMASTGSFLQNLQRALKPLDGWGPAEGSGVVNYIKHPRKRPLGDLLVYNVLGRYRNRPRTLPAHEMAVL